MYAILCGIFWWHDIKIDGLLENTTELDEHNESFDGCTTEKHFHTWFEISLVIKTFYNLFFFKELIVPDVSIKNRQLKMFW